MIISDVDAPTYFTDASRDGPVRDRDLPGSIGILESLDNHMPIGIALQVGRTDNGLAVWSLRVHA